MNDDNDDLIRFASEILTVRDELDPRVFNRNGAVHEHLRLRMLDRADYLVKETVGMIDGLLTGDVVLLGSSASYFTVRVLTLTSRWKSSIKTAFTCPKTPTGWTSFWLWREENSIPGTNIFTSATVFWI